MKKKIIKVIKKSIFDKPYPKYITLPPGYFTYTPDNVVYVQKCNKCGKEHKT
tara:strand:+ start:505 stop:660 length:156 start_codon:yes stop_codon:yes gene_type:complete